MSGAEDDRLEARDPAGHHRRQVDAQVLSPRGVQPEEAGEERVRAVLETIKRVFPRYGVTPVIVSLPVFDFMLRFYNPYTYTGLRRYRAVPYGKDILRSIDAPLKVCFVEAIMRQTQNVLGFSRSRALFTPNGNGSWLKMWSSLMGRSLRIKLYKEKGLVIPLYRELLEECGKHYPEYYRRMRRAQMSTTAEPKITREHFELLRSMADEIDSQVKKQP